MRNNDIRKMVIQMIEKHSGKQQDIEISNVEINNTGFNNNIAIFHLSYTIGDEHFSKDVVLKKYISEPNYNSTYRKELTVLKSEALKKFVNVPCVYYEDDKQNIILMEKIQGVTFDQFLLSNFQYRQFGKILGYIHSIDIKFFRDDLLKINLRQDNYLNVYLTNLRNRVKQFSDQEYMKLLNKLTEQFTTIECREVLNHGDYHFLNVILDNNKKAVVLDWEKAKIADYRFDLANSLIMGYTWFGIDFKEPMLDGYQKITGKKIKDLELFEALLSFDSFTKMIPLIEGSDDSYIRDRSFKWLLRRYELFVKYHGKRFKKAEEFLYSKGLSLYEI
ncbi:phosphotransferase [Bacillus sp. Gen3]|nr:phosphotransferase [Bacillus sp. Gen3]